MTEPEFPVVNLPPEKKAWLERRLRQRMGSEAADVGMPRRSSGEAYPLSFSQESLWFLHQLYPDLTAYNEPFAYRLSGSLNIAALQHSLDTILARHEVLRTTYHFEHWRPVQRVQPPAPVLLSQINLTAAPTGEMSQELERWLQEETHRPFDLSADQMLRASLFRLGSQEHVLLLVRHHIAADGLSERLIEAEFAECYRAALESREPKLPMLPLQYADFALWQRRRWSESGAQAQLDYWRNKLMDFSQLELPTDRPRPDNLTFQGGLVRFSVEADLLKKIRRLCQAENVTLFMFSLAVFQALLVQFSGQTDISVGTPVAGRQRPEFEPLIGNFINTLILRGDLSGDPTFRKHLQRMRQVCLEAYDNQEVPFEKLVSLFQPKRKLNRNPLIQVMFQLLNVPFHTHLQLPDLDVRPMTFDSGTAKLDLQMRLIEDRDELKGVLGYQKDLFDYETAQRLVEQYRMLLASAATDPDQRLSDLCRLGQPKTSPVHSWSVSEARFESQEELIHILFEQQALRTPERVAVVHEGHQLTYRQLNEAANRLAQRLRAGGVQVETPVGLLVERSLEMAIGFFGALKAGGVVVPLDPIAPDHRLRSILGDAGVQNLLTTSEVLRQHADLAQTITLLDDPGWMEGTSEHPPLFSQPGQTLVYILYTSGSTGRPKGVMVEHRQLASYARAVIERIGFQPGEVFAMLQPLTVDACQTVFVTSLCWGGTLHLIPQFLALDAKALAEYLRKNPADHIKIAPSHLAALLSIRPDPDLLPRRNLILGGEMLHWALVDRVRQIGGECQVWNHYGPTETTVGVLAYPLSSTSDESQHRQRARSVPIGWPLGNLRILVVDRYGNPLPVGAPGELVVGGDQVARGYLGRPQATAQSFLPDPFSETGGGRLYRTGDLARRLPDGALEFLGRMDDQVKLRGYRVELGEIEAVLGAHPAVAENAVRLHQADAGQPFLVAYCAPVAGKSLEPRAVRQYLQDRLPVYMVPQRIVMLERLPRTAQGKLDRQALPPPEPGWEMGSIENGFVTPQTEVERKLAEIWSEVLGIDSISVMDNIFELGGNSLSVMQVYARICQTFQVELSLRALFENPTIAGLAGLEIFGSRKSAGFKASADIPLFMREERGRFPVSFAQWRLWFQEMFQPGLGLYNSRGAFRLRGDLDVQALERSLNALLNRHEILRTNLVFERGELWQDIRPFEPISLQVQDLSIWPADERVSKAWEWVLTEAQRPFDLATDVMLRPTLVRLGPADHILLVVRHHTGSDAWSREIFWRELGELYRSDVLGQAPNLANLPLQYADYTIWHRKWMETIGIEQHIDYWRGQLADLVPFEVTSTPSGFEAATPRAGEMRRIIGTPLVNSLREVSQKEGTTLYMLLLAAYQVLMYQQTSLMDFGIGTAVSGRLRPEFEPIMGNFTNTLVLRARLSGKMSFRGLLHQVRQSVLSAYEHQALPFDKLVEALHPRRGQQQNPFFRLFFNMPNPEPERLALPGIRSEWLPIPRNFALFDFSLEVFPVSEGLQMVANYRVDRYEDQAVNSLLERYCGLLEQFAFQAEASIA